MRCVCVSAGLLLWQTSQQFWQSVSVCVWCLSFQRVMGFPRRDSNVCFRACLCKSLISHHHMEWQRIINKSRKLHYECVLCLICCVLLCCCMFVLICVSVRLSITVWFICYVQLYALQSSANIFFTSIFERLVSWVQSDNVGLLIDINISSGPKLYGHIFVLSCVNKPCV